MLSRGVNYPRGILRLTTVGNGDIAVVHPEGTQVQSVEVEVGEGEVAVTSVVKHDQELVGGGPGSMSWSANGDGSYKLITAGHGDALFNWDRNIATSDGSSTYDYYQYTRKGDAMPYDRYLAPDARVKTLRVQSWPYDNVEPYLVGWMDYQPRSSFAGDCNSSPLSLSVSTPVFGIGTSFTDCDKNTVWRNIDKPGSYWIEMEQGSWINAGSRSVAYTLSLKIKQGIRASMNDSQKVTWFLSGTPKDCSSTDASKNC